MTRTEEKYARATRSSHLALRRTDEAPGDADTLIAAGLAETMGVLLTRLRGEWDSAAGDVAQYGKAAREWSRLATASDAAAKACAEQAAKAKAAQRTATGDDKAKAERLQADKEAEGKRHANEAARLRSECERELVTARALILMGLRSLEPAKQALFLFAHRQAPHKACSSTDAQLATLVGQVLDVWLDRLCQKCEGRGFSGGYGSPRLRCAKCGGTGSRRHGQLGRNAAEQAFGLFLLNVMDSRCTASMSQIHRRTRRA